MPWRIALFQGHGAISERVDARRLDTRWLQTSACRARGRLSTPCLPTLAAAEAAQAALTAQGLTPIVAGMAERPLILLER